MNDLRFAIRQLLKNPGFTAVAVLTLALGIGANTAIFSVVNTVLLHPMPVAAARRLFQISERTYIQGGFSAENGKPSFNGVSPPVLDGLLAHQEFFENFAWMDGAQFQRRADDFTEVVFGERVSPNFFTLMGATPLLGRTFALDEATSVNENGLPDRDTVIVLSYSGWQSLLGGDPAVLGRTIELSGRYFTVVGVMPQYFRFPHGGVHFWFPSRPMQLPPGWTMGANIQVYARLKPGVTSQQMQALLDTVAHSVAADSTLTKSYQREWKRRPGGLGFWLRPATQRFADGKDDLQRTLWGLLGAIGFMLLIVCANVANLTLVRAEKRQQELAIRAALGAGRLRLVRLLLTESVLLSATGGVLGLAVSLWGIKLLTGLVPEFMPQMREVQLDGSTLGFTLVVSVLTGLIFGCAPAWQAGRHQLSEALKQAGLKATAAAGRRRYRNALVVAELTLSLVLLTGAGLMIQSVARLLRVDPGFDPENLVRVSIGLPWKTYNDQDNHERALQLRRNIFNQLHERLAGLPGVKAVGLGKHGAWPEKLKMEGRDDFIEVLEDGCGLGPSDLFRAMRTPLRAGRYFDPQDLELDTAIINETMARRFWPGEEVVGRKFGGQLGRGTRQFQVVGVVGDLRDYSYDQPVQPTFYRPGHELGLEGQQPFFVLRTASNPASLVPAILKELIAAEPAMTKPQITFCREALYNSTQARRTYMLYLMVFASVGLALSALGIYGVLAYSVAKRTQEIGIRMALGAERRQVLGLILFEGMRLVVLGIAVGLIAAYWLTRLMRQQLFEVQPTEPLVFVCAVLLLFGVALVACFLPARRATRINPMEALRHE